jgi:PAS domain S-box-containing protein
VLLVDDDTQWAEIIASDIENAAEECTVSVVDNGEDALERLATGGVDCLVTDYRMPGKDGLELLERVRETYPRLPTLLVTSQGSEDIAARAIEAGVDDYIIKNFGTKQAMHFVSKIRTAVDQHRMQQAIEESEQRYRTVTEQSRDAVVITTNGRLEFCNQRTVELTGKDEQTLREEGCVETAVHRGDRDAFRDFLDKLETGNTQSDLKETRIVRPDGTVRDCECSGRPIVYDGEQMALVSFRDVTDRKRRERELEWERELNRTVQEALVESETRESLERKIAQQLRNHGYALAWVGEEVGGEVVPRVIRGDRRYVETIDRTVGDDGSSTEPAIRATVTRESQFRQDFETLDQSEWQDTAVTYNYRSGAALPLIYNGMPAGVLAVYHDRAGRFDETERQLLSELADTIAFAIHSLETQSALASNRVVKAQISVSGSYYLNDISRSGGLDACGSVTVQGTVPLGEESVVQYLTLDDCPTDEVRERLLDHTAVEAVTVVEEAEPVRLQVTVVEPVPEAELAARGRVVQSTAIGGDSAVINVELPAKEEIRDIADTLGEAFGSASVHAITEGERNGERERLRGIDTAALTQKQRSALKAAYFNGYFEQPRQGSATEVAKSLGVSHSTFLRHLRKAQQKVFRAEFG